MTLETGFASSSEFTGHEFSTQFGIVCVWTVQSNPQLRQQLPRPALILKDPPAILQHFPAWPILSVEPPTAPPHPSGCDWPNWHSTHPKFPAIFLHSVILASIIRTISPSGAAGHSLGEYSALVALGAIQFYDAVKIVRVRGQAMQQAGIDNPGTMAAIIGMEADKVYEFCKEAESEGIVNCANFNSPGQVVISGSVDGVHKAMELCKTGGAKIVKELVVSGAFHSPFMNPIVEEFGQAIEETKFNNPKYPVYQNVTARPSNNIDLIKKNLIDQLTYPVMWRQTILHMIEDGATEFTEIGHGNFLKGLALQIKKKWIICAIKTENY